MMYWPLDPGRDMDCMFEVYSREQGKLVECEKPAVAVCHRGGLCREHAEYAIQISDGQTRTRRGARSDCPTDEFFEMVDHNNAARKARHDTERKARA